MIQLSKQADYGMVIMAYLAKNHVQGALSATKIASETHISTPMTAKVLKILSHQGLVSSTQGNKGGYFLLRNAEDISLIEILEALDNPVTLTECSVDDASTCTIHADCFIKPHWKVINQSLRETLAKLKLDDLLKKSLVIPEYKLQEKNHDQQSELPMNKEF
ncbi:SUF system Fe-S cluster assembly regulator [bacterium]|nr:SUF system Fe-S cluster assembly regulator [bacterium]